MFKMAARNKVILEGIALCEPIALTSSSYTTDTTPKGSHGKMGPRSSLSSWHRPLVPGSSKRPYDLTSEMSLSDDGGNEMEDSGHYAAVTPILAQVTKRHKSHETKCLV